MVAGMVTGAVSNDSVTRSAASAFGTFFIRRPYATYGGRRSSDRARGQEQTPVATTRTFVDLRAIVYSWP